MSAVDQSKTVIAPVGNSLDVSPAIRLSQVTKRFGEQAALDNVSFDVPRGIVFALLGENGAGKTTLIKTLLGLVRPDQGSAEVLGLCSLSHGLQIRQRVGCVSEKPTLYEWMTVDEIGWYTAGFYGESFLQRYRQIAGQFALPAERKIKELSKGMKAKVALGLALGHDPELLILDEPTSGLDPLVRREFLERMVDRSATGKTVFLSSHQIHEVERVADVVAILRQGKLLLCEPLEQLKNSITEVTITLAEGFAQPPLVPGEVMRQSRRARQWQVLTRSSTPEQLAELNQHNSVAEVSARRPSLEEIFTAYMQS
jgi:ABC-2 type transport system ATP-binding protein